jgi:DNA-binding MarR family transcriptional regulator
MSSPVSTQQLAQQMRELIRLYLIRQRQHTHEQGLPQAMRLLMLLHKHGPATQGEFGRLAGLDKSWISRIVERFVADGLIERRPVEADRRCLELHLTPAGVAEAKRCDALLTAHAERFFDGIPAAQHAALGESLQALVDALQTTQHSKEA